MFRKKGFLRKSSSKDDTVIKYSEDDAKKNISKNLNFYKRINEIEKIFKKNKEEFGDSFDADTLDASLKNLWLDYLEKDPVAQSVMDEEKSYNTYGDLVFRAYHTQNKFSHTHDLDNDASEYIKSMNQLGTAKLDEEMYSPSRFANIKSSKWTLSTFIATLPAVTYGVENLIFGGNTSLGEILTNTGIAFFTTMTVYKMTEVYMLHKVIKAIDKSTKFISKYLYLNND